MKKYAICLVLLLMAGMSEGQANYAVYGGLYPVTNDANCSGHNCFLPVAQWSGGSQMTLRAISSGQDLFTLGVGMGQDLWTLALTTNTKPIWKQWEPQGNVLYANAIAVRNVNEVWLLVSDAACTPTGTSMLTLWNGTSMVATGVCTNDISITGDDTLFALWDSGGNNGFMYYATNASSALNWAAGPGNGYSKVVGWNSSEAFAIANGSLYGLNLTANTKTAVPNTPTVQDVAVTAEGWLSILSSGAVRMMDLTQSNPAWVLMQGNLKNIYGGAHWGIFGTDSNFYPSHYLAVALQAYTTISGNYNCPVGGCPKGSFHTLTAITQFPNGYLSGTSSYGTLPQNQGSATSYNISAGCDMIFGDPNNPECQPTQNKGQVICAAMGAIFAESVVNSLSGFKFNGVGSELVKNNSGANGFSCTTDFYRVPRCRYNTTPNCSNLVPTYPITEVTDIPPGLAGWWVIYDCLLPGTSLQLCTAVTALKTTDPGPSASCENP